MTAKEGRKKSVRVLVAVGNGKGAAGEWGVVAAQWQWCAGTGVTRRDRRGTGPCCGAHGLMLLARLFLLIKLFSGLSSQSLW